MAQTRNEAIAELQSAFPDYKIEVAPVYADADYVNSLESDAREDYLTETTSRPIDETNDTKLDATVRLANSGLKLEISWARRDFEDSLRSRWRLELYRYGGLYAAYYKEPQEDLGQAFTRLLQKAYPNLNRVVSDELQRALAVKNFLDQHIPQTQG